MFSIKICGIELVCLAQQRFTLISSKTGPGQAPTIPLEFDSRKAPFWLGNAVLGIKLF